MCGNLQDIFSKVGFLGQKICTFLILIDIAKSFFTEVSAIYMPTNNMKIPVSPILKIKIFILANVVDLKTWDHFESFL